MTGDAHALRRAAAVERSALVSGADAVFPALIVIGRVDAEHQHVEKPHVERTACSGGRVRGHADVPDDALLLERAHVIERAVGLDGVEVGELVYAVDEAEVDIAGFEAFKLPLHGALYLVQLERPAVLPAAVVRAEVDLVVHLAALRAHGAGRRRRRAWRPPRPCRSSSRRFQGRGPPCARPPPARRRRGSCCRGDYADFLAAVRQNAVFHIRYPS